MMYRFAVYGKGGIGKSTTTTALSCAFAEMGYKVMQVGCDPKADSTLYLNKGEKIRPILDVLREKRDRAVLDELIHEGYKGIICAESGGKMFSVYHQNQCKEQDGYSEHRIFKDTYDHSACSGLIVYRFLESHNLLQAIDFFLADLSPGLSQTG